MLLNMTGFWQPMDTLRDKNNLERLWSIDQSSMEIMELNL